MEKYFNIIEMNKLFKLLSISAFDTFYILSATVIAPACSESEAFVSFLKTLQKFAKSHEMWARAEEMIWKMKYSPFSWSRLSTFSSTTRRQQLETRCKMGCTRTPHDSKKTAAVWLVFLSPSKTNATHQKWKEGGKRRRKKDPTTSLKVLFFFLNIRLQSFSLNTYLFVIIPVYYHCF